MENLVIKGTISSLSHFFFTNPQWRDMKTSENESFVHLCTKHNKSDLLTFVISNSCDLNTQNSEGDTALHIACSIPCEESIKILLANNADYSIFNKLGETPLHIAVICDKIQIFKQFSKFGCDLNVRNSNGETVLHVAIDMGLVSLAEMLICEGVKIDVQDNEGWTPLHLACKLNSLGLVKKFIGCKARMDFTNRRGEAAIGVCLKHGSIDCLNAILDTGVAVTEADVQTARETSKPSIFQQLFLIHKEQNQGCKSPEISTQTNETLSNSETDQILLLTQENIALKSQIEYLNTHKYIEEIQDISLGPLIGRGEFGEVYKAKWRNTDVAVKKFFNLKDFSDEVEVLSHLRHPNIVLLMGINTNRLLLITEFMENGNLSEFLMSEREITRAQQLQIALDIIEGLLFLHSATPSVLHRDLKSANCLVDRSFKVKIADFGLARLKDTTLQDSETFGTFPYMSPEVITSQKYSKKSDIYAFGILFCEILTRQKPFSNLAAVQILYQVIHSVLPK